MSDDVFGWHVDEINEAELTRLHSLPPNETGVPYTLPTAKLGNGTWIMDSGKIAHVLEKLHPSPSVHLESPYLTKVEQLVLKIFPCLAPICYSRVPVNILNEVSAEYWYRTRRERLGMTVQEYEVKGGGDVAYASAEPYVKEITGLLKEHDGPFFMGTEVSYADFAWVAVLVFLKRLDEVYFAKLLSMSGDEAVHKKLMDACAPWLKRSD